jgi:tetratricopeptide (TPR) repeat protein
MTSRTGERASVSERRRDRRARVRGSVSLDATAGALAAVVLGLVAGTALAEDAATAELAAKGPTALLACAERSARGERDAATRCYRARLAELSASAHGERAEVYWALRALKEANASFSAAVAAEPSNAALHARWGELYLATHQVGDAVALFEKALELSPGHLPARLGIARARAASFEPGVNTELDAILRDAPDYVEAALLRVRLMLEAGSLDDAERALDALSTQIGATPSEALLESYALRAGLDALRGKTDSDATRRALAVHPSYGSIHAMPAHFYVITRRYAEAIALLDRAVALQPDLWSAHAELGRNLLRVNEFERGRHHLERAYAGDPYDPEIVNTLRLLDQLDAFVVTRRARGGVPIVPAGGPAPVLALHALDPVGAGDAARGQSDGKASDTGMILRLHRDEAPVLEPYVRTLVEHAVATFEKRYAFTLREPVVVELYPNHDDFAVRTAGMPGLGILGAAFGYVVAMDSPSARGPSEGVHWGSVLWHELAHVFTLEATDHRVPRWLSEGLSVLEEWQTGPQRDRALPLSFIDALREDRLLPVVDLDQGFVRPTYPGQVGVSYIQAGLVCEYIEKTLGSRAIVAMLDGHRRGLDTRAVIETVLDRDPEELHDAVMELARSRAGAMLERQAEWESHRRAARAALAAAATDASQHAIARDHAQKIVALHPDDVGATSGYPLLARAHDGTGDRAAAVDALLEYRARGGADPGALRELARWLLDAERRAEAIDVLRALRYIAPLDAALHQTLAEALLGTGTTTSAIDAGPAAEALRELQIALALDPIDPVATHYATARAHVALGDIKRARRQLLQALERAPHYRPAQRMLLELGQKSTTPAPR